MNGGCVWFELHHLLLLWVYQPAFSSGLLRWFMGGAVTGQGGWGDGNRGQLCKALLPEQRLTLTMANSQLGPWPDSSRKSFGPQGSWRVQRNIDGCVVVVLEKKKLVSVKMRLERSFW